MQYFAWEQNQGSLQTDGFEAAGRYGPMNDVPFEGGEYLLGYDVEACSRILLEEAESPPLSLSIEIEYARAALDGEGCPSGT